MSKNRLLSTLSAFAVFATAQVAYAQIVPFNGNGTGDEYSPETAMYDGDGVANHMGKLTYSGLAIPLAEGLEIPFIFLNHVMTAANGDQIFMDGEGTIFLIPLDESFTEFIAVWDGVFNVLGGTGRFENVGPADAPLSIVAINDPFVLPVGPGDIWTYSWEIEGEIDLGRN